jgi:hypothetical protein
MRFDRPPDGWEPVDPALVERAGTRFDSALLRVADTAARGTTRRQFISVVGGAGLAAGLGLSGILWRSSTARADGLTCNYFDPDKSSGPCGPSPICSSTYCNSTGNCAAARTDTARRTYAGSYCTSSTSNCWTEHCCGTSYNGHAKCCDCCAPSSGGDCLGTGCPNRKCICRSRINTC